MDFFQGSVEQNQLLFEVVELELCTFEGVFAIYFFQMIGFDSPFLKKYCYMLSPQWVK